MADKHPNLAAALAAFQANLPKIGKGNTAQVRSDKGNYSYKYADLSDVSQAVLPELAKHGLSFSSKPTLTDDGRFVLAYVLRHEVDGEDAGSYPLPTTGTPQSIGSAISYARRYVLSAISGVAPDEDDDGAAATAQHDYASHRRQAPQRPAQPQGQAPRDEQVTKTPVDVARAELVALAEKHRWDIVEVRKKFAAQYSYPLREATDPGPVKAFTKLLPGMMAPATNGAVQ